MKQTDLAELAQAIMVERCSGAFYVVQRTKHLGNTRLDLLRTEAKEEVIKLFRDSVATELWKWAETEGLELANYDPFVTVNDGSILQFIDVTEVPNCAALLQQIEQHVSIAMAGSIETVVHNLWAYAVDVSTANTRCVFFRKYSKGKVIKGSKYPIVWSNAHLSRVDTSVLVVDNHVDCICIDDRVLIIDQSAFESIFGFYDHYLRKAEGAVDRFRKLGLFEDPDSLNKIGKKDPRKLRRIATSFEDAIFPNLMMKVAEMKEAYGLDIAVNSRTGLINVEQSNGWHLVKLLSDDYLASELTHAKYETQSKRRRTS